MPVSRTSCTGGSKTSARCRTESGTCHTSRSRLKLLITSCRKDSSTSRFLSRARTTRTSRIISHRNHTFVGCCVQCSAHSCAYRRANSCSPCRKLRTSRCSTSATWAKPCTTAFSDRPSGAMVSARVACVFDVACVTRQHHTAVRRSHLTAGAGSDVQRSASSHLFALCVHS
jgi:hypothetical protein